MKGLFLNELSARTMARMEKIRVNLETEESAKEIALNQGELNGLQKLSEHVSEYDRSFINDDDNTPMILEDEETEVIQGLVIDRDNYMRDDPAGIVDFIFEEINQMKDFLLYSATKPRDLNFTHGELRGIKIFDHFNTRITSERQERVRQAEKDALDNSLFSEDVSALKGDIDSTEKEIEFPNTTSSEDEILEVDDEEIDTDYEVSDEETLLTNEEEADIPE